MIENTMMAALLLAGSSGIISALLTAFLLYQVWPKTLLQISLLDAEVVNLRKDSVIFLKNVPINLTPREIHEVCDQMAEVCGVPVTVIPCFQGMEIEHATANSSHG